MLWIFLIIFFAVGSLAACVVLLPGCWRLRTRERVLEYQRSGGEWEWRDVEDGEEMVERRRRRRETRVAGQWGMD